MTPTPPTLLAPIAAVALTLGFPAVSHANAPIFPLANAAVGGTELPPYLQCVPYAREVTGINIYGDAYTWWEQADGRFARGSTPRVGAVMAFMPHRKMRLGHVAAVSRVIDSRTILLDHANWSPVDGRRGQIERNVKAIDVSPNNDWSEVRVWYDPLQGLGVTPWPVQGFIYPDGKPRAQPRQRFAQAAPPQPTREEPSKTFLAAFSSGPVAQAPRQAVARSQPRIAYADATPLAPPRQTTRGHAGRRGGDVVERAVALYD